MEVTLPPQPYMEAGVLLAVTAGAVIGGLALLLWGWLAGRFVLAVAMTAAWVAASPALAQHQPWTTISEAISPKMFQLAGAVITLAAGIFLARLVWGMLAALLLATTACLSLLARAWPQLTDLAGDKPLPAVEATDNISLWLQDMGTSLLAGLGLLWTHSTSLVIMAILAPALLAIVVALVRPRLMAILMSGLLGSAAVVLAVLVALGHAWSGAWPTSWTGWPAVLVAAIVIAIASVVLQYRWARRSDARRAKREERREEADLAAKKDKDNPSPRDLGIVEEDKKQ